MASSRIKVCVILVDRANYGRMRPVMEELSKDNQIELQIICSGSMLLERFGHSEKVVERDGFHIDGRVFVEIEGSNPVTMAKSIGLGIIEFTSEYQRLNPDIILLIGDRYEALAAVVSAAYMNISIAHIQGGEVSGSIDESTRHAITKFSHLHFASTERSAEYIVRMGENPDFVFNVGCPSGDYIIPLDKRLDNDEINRLGVGGKLDLDKPYLLVIYHPITTKYGTERQHTKELLEAVKSLNMQVLWLWPNIDAGSDHISKEMRIFREQEDAPWLHLVKNLEPQVFQKVLKNAACAVGNSSSFIRDSTFSGTPVVLVGDRQRGREVGENLLRCEPNSQQISTAIKKQLESGRYPVSDLYGMGNTSQKIIEILKQFEPYSQKVLNYIG